MSIRFLHIMLATVVIGCASSAPSSPTRNPVPKAANVITVDEINEAHADVATAFEVVARLRPNWLAPHGVTSGVAQGAGTVYAVVFYDGQRYGELNSLKQIAAYHVGEIRYYNITESGARFGIRGGSSGVIEVTSKAPGTN
jgi:hypothetical protein